MFRFTIRELIGFVGAAAVSVWLGGIISQSEAEQWAAMFHISVVGSCVYVLLAYVRRYVTNPGA